MDDIIARITDAAAQVFPGTAVAFAYVFGSRADGTASAHSDIDIAVHLSPSDSTQPDALDLRLRLADDLERAAGVGPVEVVVLDDAPLSLRGRIQERHHLIYSIDEPARVAYESLTARMYHDFRVFEERTAAERLAVIAEGR